MGTTLEQAVYRSVVDDEFRALASANPDLFGLEGIDTPTAVETEAHEGLAVSSMAHVDIQACNNTCSWGFTQLCDKFTN